jgi:hypothetical protein
MDASIAIRDVRQGPLRLLPAFLFDPGQPKPLYVLKAWLLVFLPSLLLATVVTFAAKHPPSPDFGGKGPVVFAMLVLFAPVVETFLMTAPVLLLNRFFGPVVAAVPGILIAMTGGWVQALYAALVYLIVQEIEANVLVPLIQRATVEVPPALVLLALVAFGSLFGFLGILIATPMTALLILWVKRLYVEDALGKAPPLIGPG